MKLGHFLAAALTGANNVNALAPPRAACRAAPHLAPRAFQCRMDAKQEAEAAEQKLLNALMAQRLLGKNDDDVMADPVLSELALEAAALRERAGLSPRAGSDAESSAELRAKAGLPTGGIPRSGVEPWGRWSQSDDAISLELFVPDATRGSDVRMLHVGGFLDVRLADEPLLSGRLAQEVLAQEVDWALDSDGEAAAGQKLLCIELPKRSGWAAGGRFPALFESLQVGTSADEVAAPGLVVVR